MRTLALTLTAGLALSSAATAQHDNLPLTDLTLYRSGVGSFTHSTTIEGTHAFDLRFSPRHVDDVLKSLLMLDAAPESAASVRYQSNEDLQRRLAEFSIDLDRASSIENLLAQLRGTRLTLTTTDGRREGTILGVEKRSATIDNQTSNRHYLNLITSVGIRSVPIDDITSFEFDDEQLAQELEKALATLVEARTDNLREMGLTFTNPSAERRPVAVSYVHEMPVWKTTYKLVIPRDEGANADDEPKLTLQAWAIIENTTSSDWNNVNLALAAGRPVSFTMNLDEAIYANRPTLPVPVAGGFLAQMPKRELNQSFARANDRAAEQSMDALRRQAEMGEAAGAFADGFMSKRTDEVLANTQSQSTADQAGGQFLFRLDAPITLESQQSAMLPIATTKVTGEPVSFYTTRAVRDHPLLGVRFTNDTDLHLMPGPVTVYDDDTYAGDAQIPHTSRDEEQRFTYALDLDVHADVDRKQDSFDVAYAIDEGLLRRINRTHITWTYTFVNRDDDTRTLVLDHTKAFGPRGTIVDPVSPDENEKNTITRERTLDPGEEITIEIVEQRDTENTFELADHDIDTFIATASQSALSQPLIDAMKKAASMKTHIAELESRRDELDNREHDITSDQSRIRSNMARLDRNSELYQRYYNTLIEQEDTLQAIRADLTETRKQLNTARANLRDYLTNLTID